MTDYKALRTHFVASAGYACAPEQNTLPLNPSDNALTLMQDLSTTTPVSIMANTPVLAARKLASATPTDALLVLDERKALIGITSSAELQSTRITTLGSQLGQKPDELLVHDVMRPIHTLPCVPMLAIRNTSLGNVLSTMERQGCYYLLVMENEQVRGVFCARKIAKTLGIALDITPVAHSFLDVLSAVEHPR